MKCHFILLGFLLMGCAEVRVLDIDFVGQNCVSVNGREFPLESKTDGFIVRSSFPDAEEVVFRNFDNCTMMSVWRLIDIEYPAGEESRGIHAIYRYYIKMRDGRIRPIKWYGRFSDLSYFGEKTFDTCCEVDCTDFKGDFQTNSLQNTYLHIMFDIQHTAGSSILDIIKRYDELSGGDSDVYLLPY